jgi:hypothetical protein
MNRLLPVTGAFILATLRALAGYADTVASDGPVAHWRLNEAVPGPYLSQRDASLPAKIEGAVEGVPGPLGESFSEFSNDNRAIRLTGKGAAVRIADPGPDSPLDFRLGDSITLEAWVRCDKINDGQQSYIFGKGRTQNPGVASNNQNWALRLRGQGGLACVSFLFRDERNRPEAGDEDWHRWTTSAGFKPGTEWHHVAITYTFGKPDSIRGFLNGALVKGEWDMGGPTALGPVVDDDEVWIGTSMGRSPGATLNGAIDEPTIYRKSLTLERIKAHYARKPGAVSAVVEVKNQKATPESDPVPPPMISVADLPKGKVRVEILEHANQIAPPVSETEGGNDSKPPKDTGGLNASWSSIPTQKTDEYMVDAFGLAGITNKYDSHGVKTDRSRPFLVRAAGVIQLPRGKHHFLLRSLGGARLSADGQVLVQTDLKKLRGGDDEPVPDQASLQLIPGLSLLPAGHREATGVFESDGAPHVFVVETFVGGKTIRPEFGELFAAVSSDGLNFRLLNPGNGKVWLTPEEWASYSEINRSTVAKLDAERRRIPVEEAYWRQRHELARAQAKPAPEIPSTSPDLSPIDAFITEKLNATGAKASPAVNDAAFLRRVTLDAIGLVPTPEEVSAFLADSSPNKRAKAIDRLLADPRWADRWTPYWQDVLAENPNMLKGTLNNTGPFRWWIHEALLDNKPMDRFVTELVMMRGSAQYGGPAGFGLATQNDLPMAAKAQILSSAFLAMEMKCARCHDAPNHPVNQGDLFSIAAMLQRADLKVPATSLTQGLSANSHVTVSLKAGELISPHWPLGDVASEPFAEVLRNNSDSRERLAAILTDPRNERFAQVIVNRLWKEFIGIGIVEPVDDWESSAPSHKELLKWLAHQLVTNNYDIKHVARLILNSRLYQGAPTVASSRIGKSTERFFEGPARRRLTAEQLVDSLYQVAGKSFDVEMLTQDPEARQNANDHGNMGAPRRAWEFAALSNERDRPALAKPRAQVISDLLTTFGWRESRAEPNSTRDHDANVLQPALLANGTAGSRITRLSDGSAFTALALRDQSVEELVRAVFLRALAREPNAKEKQTFVTLLAKGYGERITGAKPLPKQAAITKAVSWANHLNPEATEVMLAVERLVKAGDVPTPQLTHDWRERMEDMVWALLLSPEFIHVP